MTGLHPLTNLSLVPSLDFIRVQRINSTVLLLPQKRTLSGKTLPGVHVKSYSLSNRGTNFRTFGWCEVFDECPLLNFFVYTNTVSKRIFWRLQKLQGDTISFSNSDIFFSPDDWFASSNTFQPNIPRVCFVS